MAAVAAVSARRRMNQRLPRRIPDARSVIDDINSLLHSLNPLNPKLHRSPSPASLNQFSAYLTQDLVIEVIKNQTNPFHSLFFFNWASHPIPNPNHYRHSRLCYVAITDKLLSHSLFVFANNLLNSHNKFTDLMVSKFIKSHGDLGNLDWCAKFFFNQVRKNGSDSCVCSFNSMLRVLISSNRVSLAWAYFGKFVIKSRIVIPNVCTYTIMIRALCKVGMVEDAEKLFYEIPCEKTLFTYTALVNGLCKNGLVGRAHRIVERMGGEDGCYPSVVTYTALIDGYCKIGEVYAAVRCFSEMTSEGRCVPNVVSYNALINGLCLHGYVDEAKTMLRRMRRAGLRDNISTHTSFLNAYCNAERYDEAIEHFKEMVTLDRSIIPRLENCNVVLKSLVKLQQLDKAIRFLKEIPRWGRRPSYRSYMEVIMGLIEKRRLHDINSIYDDLIQDGYTPDAELYSSLMEVNCVKGNIEKGITLFESMIGDGYVMRRGSFEVFVKELCSRGFVNEVVNLFDQMRKCCSGFDVVPYLSVLNEYLSTARGESSSCSSSVSVRGLRQSCSSYRSAGFNQHSSRP